MQERLGVAERMDHFARMIVRNHMPQQHRDFFEQLPLLFAGHADKDGRVWASVLVKHHGFIKSPTEKTLRINALPVKGDPLESTLGVFKNTNHLPMGILGIDLSARRRNRASMKVTDIDKNGFGLEVIQSFGNCPQYIQARTLRFIEPSEIKPIAIEEVHYISKSIKNLIEKSDTFFVASSNQSHNEESRMTSADGADVSHRGGKPGFVRIDDEKTLTIPDYSGNFHFNTLGNFVVNPNAGLLFIDFDNGNILSITGKAEIIWNSPDLKYFTGAERLWRFKLETGKLLKSALPLRWNFGEYSPNSLLTGTWEEASGKMAENKRRDTWVSYLVDKTVEESDQITSFYLLPKSGTLPHFSPGQFITLQININGKIHIRNYTVSSAPSDKHLRISVKRESDGCISKHLHDNLGSGGEINIKAPSGNFYIDTTQTRPAILLSAGVGITPMVSMARETLIEGIRTRHVRPLTIIGTFRKKSNRAFFNELNEISESSSGAIRTFWTLTDAEPNLQRGRDYTIKGRISKEFLQKVLPLDDYDVYLCGPNQFMQDTYALLRNLGIADNRIHAEAFGPATLIRDKLAEADKEREKNTPLIAENAIIEYSESKVEQAWTKSDGNLLTFSENHGIQPDFGCRNGQCGSCKVKILAGKVVHDENASIAITENEALLCCATPALDDNNEITRLKIKV